MRKKLVFRLSLLIVLLTTLYSCRNEFIDYERRTDQTKQSYTAKQLNYEQLKQQSPTVADKIIAFKTLSGFKDQNSRTYVDSEEEFSVDTEKSIYIEDEKGHKTYTFKIERKETSPDILENLVLSDLGNSEFEAFISSYDKTVVESLDKFTLEDLKKHVTMAPIGKRKGGDIFGKYMANPCQIMVPSFVNIYVPGTICCHGIHNYSQIGSCTCTGSGLPTDSYSYTGISYDLFNTCDGGGASPGSGPVVTGPYNGNNPGGGFGGTILSPCKKAIKTFTKNSGIKTATVNLATKTSEAVEHGFSVMNNIDNNSSNPTENLTVGSYGAIDIPLLPTHPYTILAHTHNSPSSVTYSVPSWEDMDKLSEAIHQNPNFADINNFMFVTITADGTQYVFMIDDIDAFKNYFYKPKYHISDFDSELLKKWDYNRSYYYYGRKDPATGTEIPPLILENSTDKEKDLKYFMEIANNAGLNVFEMGANFNKFTQITMANSQIKKTECK